MFEANKNHKSYRALVTREVRYQIDEHEIEPFHKDDALIIRLEFFMPRPKSVKRQYPTVKPDGDKLTRLIADSLVDTGLVPDDSQFVEYHIYLEYDTDPRVVISIGRK
jgi:Holliday junction resolvase RusA-like endonuclease